MFTLIALALLLLLTIAVTIGITIGRNLDQIDRERLESRRWKTWRWEQELLSAAEHAGCPSCELLRRRASLLRPPSD